jgi:hypothetical protein
MSRHQEQQPSYQPNYSPNQDYKRALRPKAITLSVMMFISLAFAGVMELQSKVQARGSQMPQNPQSDVIPTNTPEAPNASGNYPYGGTGTLLPLEEILAIDWENTEGLHVVPDRDNIQKHFDEIVQKSAENGIDPALTLAIWIEETGASNSTTYGTGIHDFGCTRYPTNDFSAQFNCWLGLPKYYGKDSLFKVCRGDDGILNLREFMLIYEGGFKSCESGDWQMEPKFPARLNTVYSLLTGGGDLPLGDNNH